MTRDDAPELVGLPWTRLSTDAWTTWTTRSLVLRWVRSYVLSRSWTQKPPDGPGWSVRECFSDHGLDVRVQRVPPYQPTTDEPFYQRPGERLLVVRVRRVSCGYSVPTLETAMTFPQGNETPPATIQMILDGAAAALDAEHRRQP